MAILRDSVRYIFEISDWLQEHNFQHDMVARSHISNPTDVIPICTYRLINPDSIQETIYIEYGFNNAVQLYEVSTLIPGGKGLVPFHSAQFGDDYVTAMDTITAFLSTHTFVNDLRHNLRTVWETLDTFTKDFEDDELLVEPYYKGINTNDVNVVNRATFFQLVLVDSNHKAASIIDFKSGFAPAGKLTRPKFAGMTAFSGTPSDWIDEYTLLPSNAWEVHSIKDLA